MCSADDTSGENIGGSEPEQGVPADGEIAKTEPDTDAGDQNSGRGPQDLTPYLALVISTYGATRSLLVTAVVAAILILTCH